MAANPQPRYTTADEDRQILRTTRVMQTKRTYQFSKEALIVCWSTIAGLIIASFLFGFYSGRDYGINIALDKSANGIERVAIIGAEHQVEVRPEAESISLSEAEEIEAVLEPLPTDISADSATAGFAERSADDGFHSAVATTKTLKPDKQVIKNAAAKAPTSITTSKVINSTGQSLTTLANGFYVQIAAPRSSQEAQTLVQKMVEQSYSVGIQQAELTSGTFHRVLVGPYATAKEARETQKLMERSPTVKDTPFVRRIY